MNWWSLALPTRVTFKVLPSSDPEKGFHRADKLAHKYMVFRDDDRFFSLTDLRVLQRKILLKI